MTRVVITAEQCIRALQRRRLSMSAASIADMLGSGSRAVATALRAPTRDGRVSITYRKGIGWYRFKRLTAKPAVSA
jgi:hypothetical protein